jgi:predicted permease
VLAHGRSRSREIAVRLALGASRARLIRQLMTESILIALAGGALALFFAGFAVERFSEFQVLSDIPIRLIYKVDARAVWFTLLVSVASALIFGLAPALQATKTDLVSAMKAGDAEQMRRRIFGRSALVVIQIAGSLVVLMGAAQASFNAVSVLTADYGFRTDHRLTMRLDPTLTGYSPEQTQQFYTTLIDRLGEVSGVKSAALSFSIPMTWDVRLQTVVPEGYEFPKGKESVDVMANVVDHHYFATVAMPILQGRAFRQTDGTDSPRVVIVNQAFAQEYLRENPIGKRLRLGRNGPWAEVIGIAPNSKYISPLEPTLKYVYLPLRQTPSARMTLIVETLGNPEDMAAPVQEVIRSMDQTLPVFRVQTMDFIFENYSAKQVYGLRSMFTSAGLLALVLALVGLYAVVAYEVARRTREIGIRMAIGAARQTVMKMILRQAMKVSLTGVIIGTVLTFILGQVLKTAIEIRFNPVLLAVVSFSLFLTTLLAASIPARRAARVDPMIALREE